MADDDACHRTSRDDQDTFHNAASGTPALLWTGRSNCGLSYWKKGNSLHVPLAGNFRA
jgi:hypothetical protein